jgi:glycosyltransferase involved in cell wall biosynthesis
VDGIVVNLRRTIQHLDRERFEHRVAYLMPNEQLRDSFRAIGVEPVHLPHRGVAGAAGTIRRLVRYLRSERIELVHANHTIDYVLFGIAAQLCGIPVVASLHWLAGPAGDYGIARRHPLRASMDAIRSQMDRRVVRRIVAVSGAVRDTHARWHDLPTSKTDVVYPGLELGQWREWSADERRRARAELGIERASRVLICVGRLVPGKGQEHLLDAMPGVLERWPDAVLLLVGDGPRREELERRVRDDAPLGRAVRFLGWRSDVDRLISASDVLVLPSDSEAAPLPVLEAMKAGAPVVAARVGGVPEIVADGESGYIVPRGDATALAEALQRMLRTPEHMRRLGLAGRRIAEERFGIEGAARALERIYLEVLAERDRPRRRWSMAARDVAMLAMLGLAA